MDYKWSKQVKFHPWVGSNYENMPLKILLLGDSHHGEEGNKDFTKDVIRLFCHNQLKQKRFFNGIIWTLYGNNNDLENKYNNIAFYNYVQKLVSGPRIRPPHEDYMAAQAPFIEVLKKLQPDIVISFGYCLQYYVQDLTKEDKQQYPSWDVHSAGEKHEVEYQTLKIDGKTTPIYALPHPCGNKFNRQIYFQYFSKWGLTLHDTLH